ncbi:hypothetical protein Avbf_18313 [Armadillidium vulgare]|nr:hypothetical protein Avbf_18313 [Armadillidium vulgare]
MFNLISLHYINIRINASNKLFSILKEKLDILIISHFLLISENQKNRALEKVIFSKVPGIDSNLRIKSTSHCVFSDATKLNLMEGVFEKVSLTIVKYIDLFFFYSCTGALGRTLVYALSRKPNRPTNNITFQVEEDRNPSLTQIYMCK